MKKRMFSLIMAIILCFSILPTIPTEAAADAVEIWSIDDYRTKLCSGDKSGLFRLMTDLDISELESEGGKDTI